MTKTGRICRALQAGVFGAGVLATGLAAAGPAEAATNSCTPYGSNYCAGVTAISAGSYLAMRAGPSYSWRVYTSYPKLYNGNKIELDCWLTGSGDIDGHGDHYWFVAWQWDPKNGTYDSGYVNDWYVTTGSPSTWKKKIHQC